jgi:SNF2 family DNA or RNA helicase
LNLIVDDGSLVVKEREAVLSKFKNGKTMVLLASLKCMSVGLNLTCASQVVMVDMWWNPAIEEQAIGRVHRIGQDQPVTVTRFLVLDTIEVKIQALQGKKKMLVESVMQGTKRKKGITSRELLELLDVR